MPVTFKILPAGIVYVRYRDFVRVSETMQCFGAYLMHPERVAGQPQIVDLSEVTGFENDPVPYLALQARKAMHLTCQHAPTMVVYLATTPTGLAMARRTQRSWEGLPGILVRLAEDQIGALDLLGRSERSFAEVMANA